MNHRESPSASRQATLCLTVALLAVLVKDRAYALTLSGLFPVDTRTAGSIPYLPTIGAPALRFQDPPLPPPRPKNSETVVSSNPRLATPDVPVSNAERPVEPL